MAELVIKIPNELEKEIEEIPEEDWSEVALKAIDLKLAPHPKDVEYFALALRFDFPIWSGEKAFKKQSVVDVFSTSDLYSFLSQA